MTRTGRFAWAVGVVLLAGTLAAGQGPDRGGPADSSREVSRRLAYGLRELVGDRLCGQTAYWVIAVDISRSTWGPWNEAIDSVLNDWVRYSLVTGDRVRLIPFDREVDPGLSGSDGQPFRKEFTIDGGGNDGLEVTLPLLLRPRPKEQVADGTALVGTLKYVLKAMVAGTTEDQPWALGIVLSDRAKDDSTELRGLGATHWDVPGVAAPGGGDAGLGIPFAVRECYLQNRGSSAPQVRFEMFVSASAEAGAGAASSVTRLIPPSLQTAQSAAPPPSTPSRLWPWLLALAGLLLLLTGASAWLSLDVSIWSERGRLQRTAQHLELLAGGRDERRRVVLRSAADPSTGGLVVGVAEGLSREHRMMLDNLGEVVTVEAAATGVVVRPASQTVEVAELAAGYEMPLWTNRLAYGRDGRDHLVQCRLAGQDEPFWPEVTVRVEPHRTWVTVCLVLGLCCWLGWWALAATHRSAGPVVPPEPETESLCQ